MNRSPSPLLDSTMQSTNTVFSTDAYYFDLVRNGELTVPPHLFPNPPPNETLDPWFITPNNLDHLLHDTSIPNPFLPQHSFESSWFADSITSSFPHNHNRYFQPTNFQPTVSGSETGSAVSIIPPARRVQKGSRRCEAKRIKSLQNDEYVDSFTEARANCAGCKKSIKLDTRDGARFYPGFWLKHRGRCKKVEE